MPTILEIPKSVPNNVLLNVATGLVSGGTLSITVGNNTKFDVGEGVGYIVDTFTDIENPSGIKISWPKITGISAIHIATELITRIGVDKLGNITQFTAAQSASPEIIRDYIMLGSLQHTNNINITSTSNSAIGGIAIGNPLMITDLATSLGPIVRSGCIYSPAGAMKIARSEGSIYAFGINHKVNPKNPNIRTIAAGNPDTFTYLWRNGSGGITVSPGHTNIVSEFYDDGTGGDSVSPAGNVGNSRWQLQRIYLAPTVGTFIHYGQSIYNSEESALLGIFTEKTDILPELLGASFRGWLLVKGNCTDLSDPDSARFITASKYGDIVFHT